MNSLLFLAVVAFLLSVLLTPVVRDWFCRLGIVDWPDARRKIHGRPIPRVGGIAIALSYLISIGLLFAAQLLFSDHLKGETIAMKALPFILRMLPAAAIVFAIGLLDDIVHLSAWYKLAGQIAAASVAYFAHIQLLGVGGAALPAWLSFAATVFWLVGCCNAINLIDGLDGLAAGISLIATGTMLLAAAMQHNAVLALATVPLLGCLFGFLRYNFNPASIFLGDSGSLFIGFLLGCYGVMWNQKSATILGMTAPLIALSLPLIDASIAIFRRFLRNKPIFGADRGHVHHRLLDRGLTPRGVALLLYAVAAVTAVFSLAMVNKQIEVPVLIVFGIAVSFGIRSLRFTEFDIAGRMLRRGSFRTLLNSELSLQDFEVTLRNSTTPEECWAVLKSTHKELGFLEIKMQLAGQGYLYRPVELAVTPVWRVEVSLSDGSYVAFASDFGQRQTFLSSLADVVHRVLETKVAHFNLSAPSVVPSELLSNAN